MATGLVRNLVPRAATCWCTAVFLLLAAAAPAADTAPADGLRQNTPAVHALVGARIVVSPQETIERGTLVIRNGVIEAAGPDAAPPADARVWDAAGKTVYAGFIDTYGELAPGSTPPGGYWNPHVLPHARAEDMYSPDLELNRVLRSQGITVRLAAPPRGVVRGTSALVGTGEGAAAQVLVRGQAALHLALQPPPGVRNEYPTSPMGAMALVRQALLDADWHRRAWEAYRGQSGLPRPEASEALEALARLLATAAPVIVECPNELYALRAHALGEEFSLNVIVRGSGREYRRLDEIVRTGRAVIVPLNFPGPPAVADAEAARTVPLEELLHWDLAPENPARLARAGVRVAVTSHGLPDRGKFLESVRAAVARGWEPAAALASLTTIPAELLGVADRLGTVSPGKAAHLVVADGDLLGGTAKVLETWVDGRRYEVVPPPPADLRGTWELTLTLANGQAAACQLVLEGEAAAPGGKLVMGDKESPLRDTGLEGSRFRAALKGEPFGWEGVVRLSVVLTGEAASPALVGALVWADGGRSSVMGKKHETPPQEPPAAEPAAAPAEAAAQVKPPRQALFPVNYPLGEFGRTTLPEQPVRMLLRNATVWTAGPAGILPNASILVEAGKIAAVGNDLPTPPDAVVLDLAGKHVTPGIIDCHSHIATDGGVNESGQSNTAEVRIGDFIDPDDINIYRQLAGGVTTINILHGSANTIGGQTQLCKLRWGAGPEELKLAGAPPGIKFALGENVKQSNWGDNFTTRYPQTRMGVEQLVVDAFQAARHYARKWSAWRQAPAGLPPRVDLELEALSEVLDGRRMIHCHSYRQDEILALLRTCDAFGVRIGTLQHILEGYKLADQIAQRGIGASTFSDWWAYKFEVYDAIPYNGALMHNAGVVVSFNSDFPDLGRRLNLEAAKAVKYGGLPENEALKFVTLNPARQLGLEGRLGSIETGKDADLAVWSASPLSAYTRCEQTWIDGRKYFDRQEDQALRQEAEKMRAALVQRILNPEG